VPDLQCLDIDLMGKPRMTRRDRWAKRPCVLRYRAQADHLRLAGLRLPMRYVAVVFLRMPDSWSMAERRRQAGQPHLVRPDADNITKALLDSLAPSDAHLWDGRLQKRWAWHGRLLLLRAPLDEATLERHLHTYAPKEPGHAR
jgi:Holliday junction resolvase RusA-like endonuclease